jgi:hypothetical protein
MSCGTRVSEMSANRIHHLGVLRGVRGRRGAVAALALAVLIALSWLLVGCQAGPRTIVVEDFESGAITGWQAGRCCVAPTQGRLKANLLDQIAKTSSSNATATRRLVGSSTASS